jgi:hypothetical protein
MPVRIPSGWWTVAENSLARAWENSLTRGGEFELVGVLRLRNRSAARSSCSAQDDKSSNFAVTLSPRYPLVRDAALRLLDQDARFRAAVREGVAQAGRGEFIEEKEMDAHLERMLDS